MSYLTTATMALGVILSSVAGVACYLGPGNLLGHLGWLPQADLLFSHPGAALGAGATMIIASLLCQPTPAD